MKIWRYWLAITDQRLRLPQNMDSNLPAYLEVRIIERRFNFRDTFPHQHRLTFQFTHSEFKRCFYINIMCWTYTMTWPVDDLLLFPPCTIRRCWKSLFKPRLNFHCNSGCIACQFQDTTTIHSCKLDVRNGIAAMIYFIYFTLYISSSKDRWLTWNSGSFPVTISVELWNITCFDCTRFSWNLNEKAQTGIYHPTAKTQLLMMDS